MTKGKIDSLHGLRILCFYSLFAFHAGYSIILTDVGARVVEFFFIMSGFLMAYNHIDDMSATYEESYRILKKRIKTFYPIHILTFLLSLGLITEQLVNISLWKTNLFTAVLNIFLLQSWADSSNIYFSFNSVAWFLSSILFCYVLTPFVFAVIRKFMGQVKKLIFLFILIFGILVFIELLPLSLPNSFYFSVHVNPVVRCLDYMLGCITGVLFQKIYLESTLLNEMLKKNNTIHFIVFSIIEIVLFYIYIILATRFYETWLRAYYIPITCLIVYTISKEYGIISSLFKWKLFAFIDKIELEQFMIHQIVLRYLWKVGFAPQLAFVFAIFITFAVSWGIHLLIYRVNTPPLQGANIPSRLRWGS